MNVKFKLLNSWVIEQMNKIAMIDSSMDVKKSNKYIADLSLDHRLYC